MALQFENKLRGFWILTRLAIEKHALFTYLEFLIFRSPFGKLWRRLRGFNFNKSTLIWFKEGEGIHTRMTLMIPRYLFDFPEAKTVNLDFELYDTKGNLVRKWSASRVPLETPYVVDSRKFTESFENPKDLHISTPFSGSLLIKHHLNDITDEAVFQKIGGLFASAGTYIDYYREGEFITTLHDYSAYLPDQGMNYACLGLIPAYCNRERETFFIVHAAQAGIGRKDLKVTLFNAKGEKRVALLPPLQPFAMHRLSLSSLFPDAEEFLGSELGQVEIEGLFRQLIARVAYGVLNRRRETFSLDHCYYSKLKDPHPLPAFQREKIKKGYFNPFLILENKETTTSIVLFQSEEDPYEKKLDLLIYDERGKCVINAPLILYMNGNQVKRIEMRTLLEEKGVPLPFVGHGEVLYHFDPSQATYSKDLDLYLEMRQRDTLANVIFGSKVWNPPHEINRKTNLISYGCRVICDDLQTTYLGISNCSHDYDYHTHVKFYLDLIVSGKVVERKTLSIAPEATLFHSIEEYFPHAKDHLKESGGIGLLAYTILNSNYLVTVFLTEDRKSGALSLEHTIQAPYIEPEKQYNIVYSG